jgi:uncharacterized protein (DUF1778 family)
MAARSTSKRAARTEKVDLRLSPQAKRRIQAAAQTQNKSVSEFVLDSALTTADVLLTDQSDIRLDAKQWAAFLQALDSPPQFHERLERLLTEPSVLD